MPRSQAWLRVLEHRVLECRSACLDDPNCVTVLDHSYLNDLIGCFLNVAPCDQMVPTYDTGTLHRKICE